MSGENMSAGTIKLTNGSTAVVGTSTTFTVDLKSGDVITTTIGGVFYTLFVDTVTSATAATITDAFTGPTTTGAAYVAVPAQTMSRVPAQLAILTQEAVRRVLQENVNWQQFYSGTGDITVTLPNGTPTGLPLTGPSWAKLSAIAGTAWIDRGRIPDNSNINTWDPSTTEGTWHISGIATVTTANGFPPGAQRGVLTVVNGGYNSGTRIYVDQVANQWVQVLTAAWNGTNGPWSSWVKTGIAALSDIGVGLSTLPLMASLDWQNDDFVTGTITLYRWSGFVNPPVLTGPQPAATANMVVTVKAVVGTTIVIGLSVIRGASAYESYDIFITGAKGSRLLNVRMAYQNGMSSTVAVSDGGTGATTATAARTALGFDDAGLGNASQTLLTAFDWQQVDFASGANYLVNVPGWTNAPPGLLTPTADVVNIGVKVCRTNVNLFVVHITSQASAGSNRYDYNVRINGAKGSRTFTVIQNFNNDPTTVIPVANGGTGSTTQAGARTSLDVFSTGEIGQEFIAGLDLSVGPSSVTVSPGAAYIPSGGIARVTSALTQSYTGTANSWLHVYLYLNGTTPAIEVSGTAPVAYSYPAHQKTGAATRRYIGSIRVVASGGIPAEVTGGVCRYMVGYNGAGVIAGGKSTTEASIVINTFVPPVTNKTVQLELYNTMTDSAVFVFSKSGGTGVAIARPAMDLYVELSSVAYPYVYYYLTNSTVGSGFYCSVTGYSFVR